ncbi:hypothetical protein [Brasilonema sennae]|nr:hypothetical protein [Brasilonema sennae]
MRLNGKTYQLPIPNILFLIYRFRDIPPSGESILFGYPAIDGGLIMGS